VEAFENMISKEAKGKIEAFIHIDACRPFSCPLCSLENCPERKSEFVKHVEWNFENVWENHKHSLV